MPTTRPSLIESLRAGGNQDSWRRFAELYGPMVLRLGRRRGLDPREAEGLVQDFLVRAWKALPDFRYEPGRGRFRAWVRTVALNELRQAWRARHARERAVDAYLRENPPQRAAPDELEEWWEEAERRRVLELALGALERDVPTETLAVFRCVAVEGRPVPEVAAFYGLRPNRVSQIKCRLLKRLRALAEEITEALE